MSLQGTILSSSSWEARGDGASSSTAVVTTNNSSIGGVDGDGNGQGETPPTSSTDAEAKEPEPEQGEQDPQVAEEIRPFRLPATERVLESYSCALLPNNLLIHGPLWL